MKRDVIKSVSAVVLLCLILSLGAGCVYYNTFYNARKAFDKAETTRKKTKSLGRSNSGAYKIAIEKSLKVVENHPNSKWYDDALYVLGISYYHSGQYLKSERRLRELLAEYPDSKYKREVTLYLAKTKLQQDEITDAMEIFESIFGADYKKSIKAEAAMALGNYHFNNRNYKDSDRFYLAVRDSLGTEEESKIAQTYIADGLYDQYLFEDALGSYLQLLGLNPTTGEKYHALSMASSCSYKLQRIADGMDYLNTLIADELYFDSVGVLTLRLADGYEQDENIDEAVAMYDEVASNEEMKRFSGLAHYRLGLIYQYDFDDLKKAKEHYDKTVEVSRSSDVGRLALEKSADIGKIEAFAHSLDIDSTTTQEEIDAAAHTQYLLAELFWFRLNKPDTAILEMQYLIDSFSNSYEVPRARIALAQMYRAHLSDTATADSILRLALEEAPKSDYLPEVLDQLDLLGSAADTGYAKLYIHQAETYLDSGKTDFARAKYQYVVDNFPDSRYYLQARFALIWVTEMYDSPGDSSLIFAYSAFADSFPSSFWGVEANKRTTYQESARPSYETPVDTGGQAADSLDEAVDTTEAEEVDGFANTVAGLYISPDGDSIRDMHSDVQPERFREDFEFPVEAYRVDWTFWEFAFQVKLDFSGQVEDLKLMWPCRIQELNDRVIRFVSGFRFNVIAMPLEDQGKWQVFKHRVEKPRELR